VPEFFVDRTHLVLCRARGVLCTCDGSERTLSQRHLHEEETVAERTRKAVIAANTGEAPHVIDGLLDHESDIAIRKHAVDTAGAVDHMFSLCHLLSFRFAPRIWDLGERHLYAMSDLAHWPKQRPLIAGPVNVRASVMLRKLAGYPRQNPVARALREIGRVERALFMLDWLDDVDLRRRTNANLNKGEPPTRSPARSSSTASANCAIGPSRTSGTVPSASTSSSRPSSYGTPSISTVPPVIYAPAASPCPTPCLPMSRRLAGSMSASPATICGAKSTTPARGSGRYEPRDQPIALSVRSERHSAMTPGGATAISVYYLR
jgi:hypothetical protein